MSKLHNDAQSSGIKIAELIKEIINQDDACLLCLREALQHATARFDEYVMWDQEWSREELEHHVAQHRTGFIGKASDGNKAH